MISNLRKLNAKQPDTPARNGIVWPNKHHIAKPFHNNTLACATYILTFGRIRRQKTARPSEFQQGQTGAEVAECRAEIFLILKMGWTDDKDRHDSYKEKSRDRWDKDSSRDRGRRDGDADEAGGRKRSRFSPERQAQASRHIPSPDAKAAHQPRARRGFDDAVPAAAAGRGFPDANPPPPPPLASGGEAMARAPGGNAGAIGKIAAMGADTSRAPADGPADAGGGAGSNSLALMEATLSQLKEKAVPSFELSGALAKETNTFKGVELLYNPPPEARPPSKRWRLYVFKDGEPLKDPLYIHRQTYYLFGKDRRVVDIPTDHPSCSKQHAVLQYRLVEQERADGMMEKVIKPYLMDLGSTNGTKVNNVAIEPKRYYELLETDMIKFGNSSREYVLLHENSAG
eukprot:jgi/Mesvir1/8611/Mv04943-RA.1